MMNAILEEYPMLIFAFEALIALGLLIFIVWWTASGMKKGPQRPLRTPPEQISGKLPSNLGDRNDGDRSRHDERDR